MIKRVIFDIDNTLIPWKNEYHNEIYNVLKQLKIECTENDFNKIKQAMSKYENVYYSFNQKNMINYINEYTNKTYPDEFIYAIIDKWTECVPEQLPETTIKTLEYLKNKYELVILTDWYKEPQIKRLKKVGILKYFKEIYCAENTKRKPFKEAFMQAVETNEPEECIMIGDWFERDIEGALKAGLQAIYYNPKDTKKNGDISYYKYEDGGEEKESKYYTVSKLDEIINIL